MAEGDGLRARLHELFLDELDEHLDRLERGLGELTDSLPAVSQETVGDLFRSAHSLKGAATVVGAGHVTTLCHQLEDTLGRVRAGTLEVDHDSVGQMVRLVDALAQSGGLLRQSSGNVRQPTDPAPDPPAPKPVPPAVPASDDGGTLRIARSRLDLVLAQAGEVIAQTQRTEKLTGELLGRLTAVGDPDLDVDGLARALQSQQRALRAATSGFADAVRRVRTVPFAEATTGLARQVRDLAEHLGKQAHLVVSAADVEIDKDVASMLHEVLGHAIRNALDHGIESPEERIGVGKEPRGTIRLGAVLRSDGLEVTVEDDGRGIDVAEVRRAARALGLDEGLGRDGLNEVLFVPGLSTADAVSRVSGRGVGLDAVRGAVEAAGGSVALDSSPGTGARLVLHVPLTLSTLRVMLARVDAEVVAVPTSPLRGLVRVPDVVTRVGGRDVLEVDGAAIPLAPLAQVLGWQPDRAGPTRAEQAMVIGAADGAAAVVVDELIAEREVVLRTSPARLSGMSLLLGTADLEDGTCVLVLSPAACVRGARAAGPSARPDVAEPTPSTPRVLLVEDTITTRELERTVLIGAGYQVVVAVDGQQAWEMLQAHDFDIVVSDVNMPRMDGIALCRAIRASRNHEQLPVVLVTSLHSDADRRRGLDAGADAYLTKSGFDRAELLATLERLL